MLMKTHFFLVVVLIFSVKMAGQQLVDCSICSTQVITNEQITKLTLDQVQYLSNDLFARKGHRFSDPHISMYFSEKNWYQPKAVGEEITFNDIENQNLDILKQRISDLQKYREKLMIELKKFKFLVLNNQKEQLQNEFGYLIENEQNAILLQTLVKIELDDIHWQGNDARYQLQVDNGNDTTTFGVYVFENKEVGFKHTLQEETTNLGTGFYNTDFYVEKTYYWYFEWKNGKLTFVNLIMAD